MNAIENYKAIVNDMGVIAPDWARHLAASIPSGKTGSAHKWFTDHNGEGVLTYTLAPSGKIAWCPGLRTVSAGASFATLDGSRIDYSAVLLASSDMLVLGSFNGSMIAYIAS